MDEQRVRKIVREELAKLMAAGLRRPGISGDPPHPTSEEGRCDPQPTERPSRGSAALRLSAVRHRYQPGGSCGSLWRRCQANIDLDQDERGGVGVKQYNIFLGRRLKFDMPAIVSVFLYRPGFVSLRDHSSRGCSKPSLRQDHQRLPEPNKIIAALALPAQPHTGQQPFARVLLAQREVERHRVVLTLSTWNGLDFYFWSENPKHGHDPNHGSAPGQQLIDQVFLLCLNLVQGERGAAVASGRPAMHYHGITQAASEARERVLREGAA